MMTTLIINVRFSLFFSAGAISAYYNRKLNSMYFCDAAEMRRTDGEEHGRSKSLEREKDWLRAFQVVST